MGEETQVATNQGSTSIPTTVALQVKSSQDIRENQGIEKATEKAIFSEWLAYTKTERKALGLPISQEEFAEKYDVAAATLSRWKHDPVFEKELTAKRAAHVRIQIGDALPEITKVLVEKAKGGNLQAIGMTFDATGVVEKQAPVTKVEVAQTQTITLEQALKKNGESLEGPSWLTDPVIDVPAEVPSDGLDELVVKGEGNGRTDQGISGSQE